MSQIQKPVFTSPEIFSGFNNVIAGESTRHGGVSETPYKSLNLGGATQDDPDHVLKNNHIFFGALGVRFEQVAKSHQVHGCEVLKVVAPGRYEGFDAMITNVPGIQLAVTIADCTPILIYDNIQQAVAAIHAGWKGTVQEIVKKTVAFMQKEYTTNPADCFAYVGTCIDDCSFEVGAEVAENFSSVHKHWNSGKEKFYVDLKAANRDQLIETGFKPAHIGISAYSTVLNNDDYFSYRAEKGVTGRMLATIGII